MRTLASARNVLFALTLMVFAAAGCGNPTESEPSRQQPVLRKKVSVPKEPAPPAVKPAVTPQAAKLPAEPGQETQKAKLPAKPGQEAQIPAEKAKLLGEPGQETQAPAEKAKLPAKPGQEAQIPAERAKEKVSETTAATKPPVEETSAEPPPTEKERLIRPDDSGDQLLAEVAGKKPTYDPAGKPDPFKSPFSVETERVAPGKKTKEKRVPVTPLQRIELSQLKLVGVIISPTGNKALVEEPSGKGYIISKGTYVGTNFGQVKRVLRDRVIVEEEVEDFLSGGMKLQTTELTLQKKVGDV